MLHEKTTQTKKKTRCTFKASYWGTEIIKDKSIIHIGGTTADAKSVHICVVNYLFDCYIELPRGWQSESQCRFLYSSIQARMLKMKGRANYTWLNGPVGGFHRDMIQRKDNIYHEEPMITLHLKFQTERDAKALHRELNSRYGIGLEGCLFPPKFNMHHHNIPTVIKYASDRRIDMAGWVEVVGKPLIEIKDQLQDAKDFGATSVDNSIDSGDSSDSDSPTTITTADIELYVEWNCIIPSKVDHGMIFPKYCSFDIECYSKNHDSKLPDPLIKENVVNQISMVFGRLYDPPEKRHHILLSLGHPDTVKGCDELLKFKSEKEMLLKFTEIIQTRDPDIFTGYNIMKFDFDYMIIRAQEILGIYDSFAKLSRVIGKKSVLIKDDWSSAAYGNQVFSYLESTGRVIIDGLLEIERSHKLPTYSLNAVAAQLLGKTKDDITAQGLFMLWKMTDRFHANNSIIFRNLTEKTLETLKEEIKIIFELRLCKGTILAYRDELLASSVEAFESTVNRGMELMGKYCIKDSVLAVELVEKYNLYPTMEEFSNVTGIPMSFLYTRGQQIRVVAQFYRMIAELHLIIPYSTKDKHKESFEGALVRDAKKGYHKDVSTLDFKSLYPSILIANNICYTTLLKDTDRTKDEDCHVIAWKSHVRCPHDPLMRKKGKNDKEICEERRYRFRKIVYEIDEDGEIHVKFEGIVPKLLRLLLAKREAAKVEMDKWDAICKMHTGKASEEDIKRWVGRGMKFVPVGSLTKEEFEIANRNFISYNSKQLSLKITANSIYGILGAQMGMMPSVACAASVTAKGREYITLAGKKLEETYDMLEQVYGDTDSTMVKFRGKTLRECFGLAKEAANLASHYLRCQIVGITEDYKINGIDIAKIKSSSDIFKSLAKEEKIKVLKYENCPITLEFENMYASFLLFTKKRYVAQITNIEGKITGRTKKGMCEVRRNGCPFLRESSKRVNDIILGSVVGDTLVEGKEQDALYEIYDRVNMLFVRNGTTEITDPEMRKKHWLPDEDFIITMGIKDMVSYAKSRKVEKNGTVVEKIPIDVNGKDIENVTGPLDPRLIYSNIPHVVLAKKMLERGESIPSNTRLEYVYLENPDAKNQGEKAEAWSTYEYNKETLKIDKFFYIEKQLLKPLSESITARFKKGIVPFIPIYTKVRESFFTLNELHRTRVAKVSEYCIVRPEKSRSGAWCVGWAALRKEGYQTEKYIPKKSPRDKFTEYTYKDIDAKVAYLLEQFIRPSEIPYVSRDAYSEVFELCKVWRSKMVLDAHHEKHGIPLRKWRVPKGYSVENIIIRKKVYMLNTLVNFYTKGDIGRIVNRTEIPTTLKKKNFTYDILFKKTGIIAKNVDRKNFTLFTVKDGYVMDDILFYRKTYHNVVIDIRSAWKLFSRKTQPTIIFSDDEDEKVVVKRRATTKGATLRERCK